jgi:hypothetical protein
MKNKTPISDAYRQMLAERVPAELRRQWNSQHAYKLRRGATWADAIRAHHSERDLFGSSDPREPL